MTREKQIIKEAERLIDPYEMVIDWEYERGLKEGFVKGAKWADETMLDKACEWLENVNTDDYMDSGIFQMHDMIMDFKKAMTR